MMMQCQIVLMLNRSQALFPNLLSPIRRIISILSPPLSMLLITSGRPWKYQNLKKTYLIKIYNVWVIPFQNRNKLRKSVKLTQLQPNPLRRLKKWLRQLQEPSSLRLRQQCRRQLRRPIFLVMRNQSNNLWSWRIRNKRLSQVKTRSRRARKIIRVPSSSLRVDGNAPSVKTTISRVGKNAIDARKLDPSKILRVSLCTCSRLSRKKLPQAWNSNE